MSLMSMMLLVGTMGTAGLAYAATVPTPPALAAEQRALILGLVVTDQSLQRITRVARRTAKVPVLAVRQIAPGQISLRLRCGSAKKCDAAQARLAAATSWVRSVDVDAVRTRPKPVTPHEAPNKAQPDAAGSAASAASAAVYSR
jgi:hypothetical protein